MHVVKTLTVKTADVSVLVTLPSTLSKNCSLGAKAVTCSDSSGFVYDPDGIDVDLLKEIKEVKRERIVKYAKLVQCNLHTCWW